MRTRAGSGGGGPPGRTLPPGTRAPPRPPPPPGGGGPGAGGGGAPPSAFVRHWVRKECLVKLGVVTLDELSHVELDPTTEQDVEEGRTRSRFGPLHLLDWVDPTLDVAVAADAHGPPGLR